MHTRLESYSKFQVHLLKIWTRQIVKQDLVFHTDPVSVFFFSLKEKGSYKSKNTASLYSSKLGSGCQHNHYNTLVYHMLHKKELYLNKPLTEIITQGNTYLVCVGLRWSPLRRTFHINLFFFFFSDFIHVLLQAKCMHAR